MLIKQIGLLITCYIRGLNRVGAVLVFLLLASLSVSGQCEEFEIEVTESVCRGQNLFIENNADTDKDYFWDFCAGQLAGSPESTFVFSEGESLVDGVFAESDGFYWGFFVDRTGDRVWRAQFTDLTTSPLSISSLGSFSNLLNNPDKIVLHQENNSWYAFVTNDQSSNNLIRFDFGNSLGNSPTATNMGNAGGTLNRPRGMSIINDDGNLYLIASNRGDDTITSIDFGSSVLNAYDATKFTEVTGSNLVFDMSLVKECGVWYGFAVSLNNGNIHRLVFDNGLGSQPVYETVDLGFDGLTQIELLHDGMIWRGFTDVDNELYRLDFFNGLADAPNVSEITPTEYDVITSIILFSDQMGFVIDNTALAVHRLDFDNGCLANKETSNEYSPSEVQYQVEGTFYPSLRVTDESGIQTFSVDTVMVSNDVAPSVSFLHNGNICISNENTFDATADLGVIYSWDFNEDGVEDSNSEDPTFQYSVPGDYNVTLYVSDGTCTNVFTEDITVYGEPPVPNFQTIGLLCASDELSFNNLTNDESYEGPLEYTWDFNGQGTSSERDPTFLFGSGGSKTVTLTSSIPGCEKQVQYVLDLLPGPTAQFSSGSVCENDELSFSNQSMDADSYLWDFGDGFITTQANPTHIFSTGGVYTVSLIAQDANGCVANTLQEVSIPYLPEASFSFDVPCSGSEGFTFSNDSFVTGADIATQVWYVDGEEVTTEKDPLMTFDEPGERSIRLEVTSTNGCTSSTEQTINILEEPDPTFTFELSCSTLPTTFLDQTPKQDEIVSRIWSIDGSTYSDEEVSHVFGKSGTFDVSLSVTSQNFCSRTIYSTVTVPSAPVPDFTMSSECIDDPIELNDISTSGDPIVSRNWSLDGEVFFNGETAQITSIEPGIYEIGLEVSTQLGCQFSTFRSVEIKQAPDVEILPSVTYGAPPLTVDFASNANGGHSWFLSGDLVSSSDQFSQTFTEEGYHEVTLQLNDGNGCIVTREIDILVRVPSMDLEIEDLSLDETGSGQTVTLSVRNRSNLPIEIFDILVTSGDDFSITERFNQFIGIGEETDIELSSSLQFRNSNSVCATIISAFDDISPSDNEFCVSLETSPVLDAPFPNPVGDELTVRVILDEDIPATLQITNSTGRIMVQEEYALLAEGLSAFTYDTRLWEKGMYFITLIYGDSIITEKILKQ